MNLLRWARAQWDRVLAWTLIGLGVVTIVVGWVQISHEALTAKQIPYIASGGIGGLFLLGLGATLILSADLRDEWRKLDEIAAQGRDTAPAENCWPKGVTALPAPSKARSS
ncbi:MAG TPA: hypothetical protein VHL53_17640 [Acidimicrobiia bacterium]|nr:hypothetical protein [Acidimicrobiia bacterium]